MERSIFLLLNDKFTTHFWHSSVSGILQFLKRFNLMFERRQRNCVEIFSFWDWDGLFDRFRWIENKFEGLKCIVDIFPLQKLWEIQKIVRKSIEIAVEMKNSSKIWPKTCWKLKNWSNFRWNSYKNSKNKQNRSITTRQFAQKSNQV